jgi:histone arginine demethylase JMJD6
MYANSWPSLFIGARGTFSPLHIDSFNSNFWMFVVEGEKQWTLFSRDEMHLLHPFWFAGSINPIFSADLHNPDFGKYPALQ